MYYNIRHIPPRDTLYIPCVLSRVFIYPWGTTRYRSFQGYEPKINRIAGNWFWNIPSYRVTGFRESAVFLTRYVTDFGWIPQWMIFLGGYGYFVCHTYGRNGLNKYWNFVWKCIYHPLFWGCWGPDVVSLNIRFCLCVCKTEVMLPPPPLLKIECIWKKLMILS